MRFPWILIVSTVWPLSLILSMINQDMTISGGHLCPWLPTHRRGPDVRLPPAAEEGEEDAQLPGLVQDLETTSKCVV